MLALVFHVHGWWLDPRFNLEQKPQMLDALEFAQPRCSSGLVLDVGANGGRETMQARRLGYDVIAVECLSKEFVRLSERFRYDRRITLLNGCASETLSLQPFSEADAGSSLHREAVSQGEELSVFNKNKKMVRHVMTFPIDPLVATRPKRQPVCVVKIDTQGHEVSVMRGAERTLKQHRPVVIFELDYRFGPQVNLSVPWIQKLGYDCAVPTPGKGPGRHCATCNVLCMPDKAMWRHIRPPRPAREDAVHKRRAGRRLEGTDSSAPALGHRW